MKKDVDNQDGIAHSEGMKTNNQIEVQVKQLASDFCNWLEQEGYLGVSRSGLLQWAENCRPEILNSPATLRGVYNTASAAWN